jgi:hypothetical protein
MNHALYRWIANEGTAPGSFNFGTRWVLVISFTHLERAPSTQWVEGWVDDRPGLNAAEKRQKYLLMSKIESVFGR